MGHISAYMVYVNDGPALVMPLLFNPLKNIGYMLLLPPWIGIAVHSQYYFEAYGINILYTPISIKVWSVEIRIEDLGIVIQVAMPLLNLLRTFSIFGTYFGVWGIEIHILEWR